MNHNSLSSIGNNSPKTLDLTLLHLSKEYAQKKQKRNMVVKGALSSILALGLTAGSIKGVDLLVTYQENTPSNTLASYDVFPTDSATLIHSIHNAGLGKQFNSYMLETQNQVPKDVFETNYDDFVQTAYKMMLESNP